MPASAERTCSTVWILTLPSASVVARSTVLTFSTLASMIGVVRKVRALELKAVTDRRRMKRESDIFARVQGGAGEAG